MTTKKNHYIVLILFMSILMGSCHSHNTVSLFNGKDLKGWYAFDSQSGRYDDASELYTVKDGIIKLYGETSGYLMSKSSYKDFKLTVEYRWSTDTSLPRRITERNSGIMYLVPEHAQDMLWPRGIQFQVKEGATGDFILLQNFELKVNGQAITPGESVVIPRIGGTEAPLGEWNSAEITVNKGYIIQKLNGTITNEGSQPSVNMGRILIQYEGYPIEIKRIDVEKL